jgi:hypothetical protein
MSPSPLNIIVRLVNAGIADLQITLTNDKTFQELISTLIVKNYLKTHDSSGKELKYKVELLRTRQTLQLHSTIEQYNIQQNDLVLIIERDNDKMTPIAKVGSFAMGSGLVVLGVVDAIWNPFAFITAPKLFAAGTAMITIGLAGKKNKNDRKDN